MHSMAWGSEGLARLPVALSLRRHQLSGAWDKMNAAVEEVAEGAAGLLHLC